MRSLGSLRSAVLLVAGVVVSGCSKDDREPSIAVSSAVGSPATVDSAVKTDTAPASATTALASPVDTPPPVAPAKRRKPLALPKPSIDPGQITPSATADSGAMQRGAESQSAAPGVAQGQDKWLSYDAASNTVTFELVAGPFTFNGYRNGEGTLALPPKANVVMTFVNKDGTPHSAEVISGEGAIPNAAVDAAIPRAYTNKVLEGLPQEASDVMRFAVPDTGTYRIFCGVPGHGLSGMWIWMKVDPAAKAPSFGATKG